MAYISSSTVSVPLKKLKNKKFSQKVRRLKDFCDNVSSYIDTIIFKLTLTEVILGQRTISQNGSTEIEGLVNKLIDQDLESNARGSVGKKGTKITSLKVVYIYLRDNSLFPKRKAKHLNTLLFYSVAKAPEAFD